MAMTSIPGLTHRQQEERDAGMPRGDLARYARGGSCSRSHRPRWSRSGAVDDPIIAASTALVCNERDRIAFGLMNPWHQTISPLRMPRQDSCFVPRCPLQQVGPTRISPSDDTRMGRFGPREFFVSTTCSTRDNRGRRVLLGPRRADEPAAEEPTCPFVMNASRSWSGAGCRESSYELRCRRRLPQG